MASVIIKLTEKEIDYANAIGLKRHHHALHHASKNKLGPRDNVADAVNDQVAARCELAAHIGLGTNYWHAYSETYNGKEADLDHFIDVKARGLLHHNLIVQLNDPPEFAYVSVYYGEHPKYSIDGWLWGKEIQFPGYIKALKFNSAYAIKPINNSDAKLKTPQQLMEIVRQKLARRS